MVQPSWPAAAVAIAFLALVGYIFGKAVEAEDFETIWAAVGSLVGAVVGVATGSIPTFFFRAQAQAEKTKSESLQAVADPDVVKQAQEMAPGAWGITPSDGGSGWGSGAQG